MTARTGDAATIIENPAGLSDVAEPVVMHLGAGRAAEQWFARSGEPHEDRGRWLGSFGLAVATPLPGPEWLTRFRVGFALDLTCRACLEGAGAAAPRCPAVPHLRRPPGPPFHGPGHRMAGRSIRSISVPPSRSRRRWIRRPMSPTSPAVATRRTKKSWCASTATCATPSRRCSASGAIRGRSCRWAWPTARPASREPAAIAARRREVSWRTIPSTISRCGTRRSCPRAWP